LRLGGLARLLVAAIVGLAGAAGPARADFESGVAAYDSGDYSSAIAEFRRESERGQAASEFMLGVMYFYGKGVMRDDGIAAVWFHKAAGKGYAGAQLAYGSLHIRGVGVRRDPFAAYFWLTLAGESGIPGLQQQATVLRDDAARGLTPSEIERAQRKAGRWKPTRAGLVLNN
jgi:TPR repeat protein